MQIVWVKEDGTEVECAQPYPTAAKVVATADGCCPKCQAREEGGKRALFCGNPEELHWGWRGIAACAGCHAPVGGTIEVRLATLFGREEDGRVLSGRWRVY